MSVRKLLDSLGQELTTCRPDDTIYVGAATLTTRGIGAVPVCDDDDSLVGIISERDIVHAFANSGCGLQGMKVREVMSTDVVSCSPDDSLDEARVLMREHRIRHLPVVVQGAVVGIISIRDLLDAFGPGVCRDLNAKMGSERLETLY